jgi:hypothetical protein
MSDSRMSKKPNPLESLKHDRIDRVTTILRHRIRRQELTDQAATAYQSGYTDHEPEVLSVTIQRYRGKKHGR